MLNDHLTAAPAIEHHGGNDHNDGPEPIGAPLDPAYAQFRDQTRFWIQRVAVPLIMVVGLFGNLITVIIMTRRRMRATTNLYLAALAFVDMLYLVLTFLLGLSHYPNMARRRYHLYWHLKPFLMMLTDACSNTSVWLTVTFTIERFIAVKYPMRGKLWCTEARAKRLIVCVFLVAILFTLPVPFEWKVVERRSEPTVEVGGAHEIRDEIDLLREGLMASNNRQFNGTLIASRPHMSTNSTATADDEDEPEAEFAVALENSDFGLNETYKTIYYWSTAAIFYFIPLLSLTFFNGFLIHSVHRSRRERNKMTNVRAQTSTGNVDSHEQLAKSSISNRSGKAPCRPIGRSVTMNLDATQHKESWSSSSLPPPPPSGVRFETVGGSFCEKFDSQTQLSGAHNVQSNNEINCDKAALAATAAAAAESDVKKVRAAVNRKGALRHHKIDRQATVNAIPSAEGRDNQTKVGPMMRLNLAGGQDNGNESAHTQLKIDEHVPPIRHLVRGATAVGAGANDGPAGRATNHACNFSMARNNQQIHAPLLGHHQAQQHTSGSSQERRITIMLIAVVILFLVCQIPSAAMLLYTSVHDTVPNTNEHALLLAFGNIFNFLMAINAAGNFILYSFLSKKYRRTFVILFCGCLRRAVGESANINTGRPIAMRLSSQTSAAQKLCPIAQATKNGSHNNINAELLVQESAHEQWTRVRFSEPNQSCVSSSVGGIDPDITNQLITRKKSPQIRSDTPV